MSIAKAVSRGVCASLGVGLICLSTFGPARAELLTIHMDEVASQAVNGLQLQGVHFGFDVNGQASDDATINAFGVGSLVYVDDPSLEGTTQGRLSLQFDQNVDYLAFGIALQSEAALNQAVRVRLLDASRTLVAERWLDMAPLAVFSEAWFAYEGPIAIGMAEISFSAEAPRFVLDNLSYAAVPVSPVPEPAGWILSLAGLPLLMAALRPGRRAWAGSLAVA